MSHTLVRQETIARLKAFGGLKQQLWGVSFTQGPENVSAHARKPAYTSSLRPLKAACTSSLRSFTQCPENVSAHALKAASTSSLRPHTSSVRPHTLVA
jgi:hypothetical protein